MKKLLALCEKMLKDAEHNQEHMKQDAFFASIHDAADAHVMDIDTIIKALYKLYDDRDIEEK